MSQSIQSNTLVDAATLAAALAQPDHRQWLRVLDARFSLADPDAGQQDWQAAHIIGARYVHLDRDLSDHRKPATHGRHPLPDPANFVALLVRLDIGRQHQVIIYDAGDGAMAAARCWWLLQLIGHRRAAVLDGGLAQWRKLGLPETAEPAVTPSTSSLDWVNPQFDRSMMIDTKHLITALANDEIVLLDARAAERYRGEVEPIDKLAGHIPGALNRPYSLNLADGRFKSAEQLRAEFNTQLAARSAKQLVLSCGSGVTACHHALALAHAGLHGARLYPPSWSGWIESKELAE